ncbi:MAG: hypothetical protein ACLFTE_02060 [Salinivenus sp.]
MVLLKWTLVVLHIITAAAWFGLGLRLAGRARSILGLSGEAQAAVAEDGARSVWLMNLFVVLTLVFSIGAFIAGGHFVAYGPAYHSAVTLVIVLTLVQLFVIRPGWTALQDNVGLEGTDAEAAGSAKTKVAIGTGVGHLLWLVLLGLMFWDQFAAAL